MRARAQEQGRKPGPARGRRRPAAGLRATGLAVAAAVLAAGALVGCGSGGSPGTSADPAGLAPAATAVYVSAVVRPNGSLKTAALTAGHKLTGQADPYLKLLGALQTPGSPKLSFGSDVAPWLGSKAAIFFTSLGSTEALESLLQQGLTGGGSAALSWPFGSGGGAAAGAGATAGSGAGAQGAIVLDTSDLAKARAFVAAAAAHAGAHPSTYRGVAYNVTSGGDAFAIVDRFAVLGTEAGVHAAIDTAQGGPSLQGDSSYAKLLSVAPGDALAHVYANPAALSSASTGAAPGTGAKTLPSLLTLLGGARPLDVSLVPTAGSIALDTDIGPAAPAAGAGTHTAAASSQSTGLVGAAAAGAQALGELPGEAWLAAGLGNVGGTLGGSLEGLHGLLSLAGTLGGSSAGEGAAANPQATLSVQGLLAGLLKPLNALSADNARARRDYLSWMGETGIFASGTSVLSLKAAVVIDSKNPAASRAAVGELAADLRKAGGEANSTSAPGAEAAAEAKLTGLPVILYIADGRAAGGRTKFVIGLGPASVQEALSPTSTFSSTSASSAAASALGEGAKPSIAVNFSTLLSLLEGVGLSEDPTVSKVVPYLRASTSLSGGGVSLGGGVERLRLVLGLQPGG